ncbi:MAG: DJ-1/PfpI family protein [Muribaculaceae bacterium]|nr:DJ-1/PfpI family protein [Muribaculaceae bacterium]
MKKESFVILADGFELIEAMTPVDVLRRAGMDVKTVSINATETVMSANGVAVLADCLFDAEMLADAEWIILPGGMPGAVNLYEFEPLREVVEKQYNSAEGKIASICASPAVVLGQMGLLKGRKCICYPGFEEKLEGGELAESGVTVDDKFVLGAGPGLALAWSLEIAKVARGEEVAAQVADGMLVNRYK